MAEGMRAVAVHVTDSTGVLALLRAGQTVDVQVVVNRKDSPHGTEVRTAIEDLTVLAVRAATRADFPRADAAGGDATRPA